MLSSIFFPPQTGQAFSFFEMWKMQPESKLTKQTTDNFCPMRGSGQLKNISPFFGLAVGTY
jgi:hypothetical protein